MKNVLLIYAVLIIAILSWWLITDSGISRQNDDPEPQAIKISKHSDEFNESVSRVMESYYKAAESLGKNDNAAFNKNAVGTLSELEKINLEELKKDTAGIYETATSFLNDVQGSLQQTIDDREMEAKRTSFKNFSDNLYTFLNTIRYDGGVIYWMECPTAFGEGSPGYWLSNQEKSVNPYGQPDCGQVKKTMNAPSKE